MHSVPSVFDLFTPPHAASFYGFLCFHRLKNMEKFDWANSLS